MGRRTGRPLWDKFLVDTELANIVNISPANVDATPEVVDEVFRTGNNDTRWCAVSRWFQGVLEVEEYRYAGYTVQMQA